MPGSVVHMERELRQSLCPQKTHRPAERTNMRTKECITVLEGVKFRGASGGNS